MDDLLVRKFVDKYDSSIKEYSAYYYGGPDIADELCKYVLDGNKRATTSLYELYNIEKEELPKIGNYSVILDSKENPKCITKITDIKIVKFCDISSEYAYTEGEGDKSLSYWKNAHREVFSQECEELGIKFNEEMFCVCEFFDVVYVGCES